MFHRRWNIPARGPGVDMTLSRYSVRVEMVGTTAMTGGTGPQGPVAAPSGQTYAQAVAAAGS